MTEAPCSPGSHPHSDRPNWQPAETIEDYFRQCEEGLENFSGRRMAKLFGISRAALWRWRLMAQIPEDLFNLLMEKSKRRLSTKSLAAVGRIYRQASQNGDTTVGADVELCPHCGEVLRLRHHLSDDTIKIVNDWLATKRGATPP
jgi:hypothetical protein